ncbi:MAG: hypothetical protein JSR31_05140 [Nitrospira sp.]|nr:hypothetical protein [Nitrospira sp.]
MRTFLFLCSALSLLISAHKFSLVDASGQYKGALFFLLLGIQMLITGALIGDHQDERDLKSQMETEKKNCEGTASRVTNQAAEQRRES